MTTLRLRLVPHYFGRFWLWFGHRDRSSWSHRANTMSGKFLFFARDPELLYGIAAVEIADHGFRIAKVCLKPNNGRDYVLCLYAPDDSRLDEVEARHEREYGAHGVVFRGWKLNIKTAAQGRARGLRRAPMPLPMVEASQTPRGEHGRAQAEATEDPDPWADAEHDPWIDVQMGEW